MTVLPDHIVVLERGWLSSNNIVFLDDAPAVVDTGYVTHGDDTARLLARALAGRPLARILNTHLHSDHAGGNALLQAAYPDSRTLIPPDQAQAVADWDEDRLSYRDTGQLCPRFRHDGLISPGDTLPLGGQDWAVLPAAGHDHAMVMLWCERLGVLISADALWRNGFGVIFPELDGLSGFAEQQATLDLIAQLAPRLVIPGHGAPFTDVAAALAAATSRIRWLAEDPRRNVDNALKGLVAFKLLERGRMTLADLVDLIGLKLMSHPVIRAHYPQDPERLAALVGSQLERVGAAVREGDAWVARA